MKGKLLGRYLRLENGKRLMLELVFAELSKCGYDVLCFCLLLTQGHLSLRLSVPCFLGEDRLGQWGKQGRWDPSRRVSSFHLSHRLWFPGLQMVIMIVKKQPLSLLMRIIKQNDSRASTAYGTPTKHRFTQHRREMKFSTPVSFLEN